MKHEHESDKQSAGQILTRSKRDAPRSQLGQTLVEFSLVLPLLLILIFGIIETARLFQAYITVQSAARLGARYGITGQCGTGQETDRPLCIVEEARRQTVGLPVIPSVDTPGYQPAPGVANYLDVTLDPPDFGADSSLASNNPNWQGWVTVTVSYNFNPLVPLTFNVLGSQISIIPDVITVSGHSTLFSEVVYRINPLTEAGYTLTCDPGTDTDSDNVPDLGDNCPGVANSSQIDVDGDNYGAACELDDNNPNDPDVGGRTLACQYYPEQSINTLVVTLATDKTSYTNPGDISATLTVTVDDDGGSPLTGLAPSAFITRLDGGSPTTVTFNETGTPGTYTGALDISLITGPHTVNVEVSNTGLTGNATASFSRSGGGGGPLADSLTVTLVVSPSSASEGTASISLQVHVEEEGPAPKLGLVEGAFTWSVLPAGASIIPGTFTDNSGGDYSFDLDVSSLVQFTDYPVTVQADDGAAFNSDSTFFAITAAGGDTISPTVTISPNSYVQGTSSLTLQVHVDEEGPLPKTGLAQSAFTWTALPAGSTIAGGSFADNGSGNYSFGLNIGSLTPAIGYQVDLSVDDGTAIGTTSATFDITASGGGSCSISANPSFVFSGGNKISWTIANNGATLIRLNHVIITWPDGGGELDKVKDVKWAGNKIWDGPGGDTSSTTDMQGSGFNLDPGGGLRTLGSGNNDTLEIKFDPKDVETSGYTYTVFAEFQLVSTPAITCSVSLTETYP